MTGPFKSVPTGADQLPSFQIYQNACQAELNRRTAEVFSSPAIFDPAKASVFNRNEGDGRFEVLYEDRANDFFCGGQWLWPSRELLVRSGKISDRSSRPIGGGFIGDACNATQFLAGGEEFAGQSCSDGAVNPLATASGKFSSLRQFEEGCKTLLGQRGQDAVAAFSLQNSRVDNPVPGDAAYSLFFESRAKGLFCAGDVDVSSHQMFLRSGKLSEYETAQPVATVEMTDACSLTRELVGERELLSPDCKDMTARERKQVSYITYGFYGVANVLAILATYKLGKKVLTSQAFTQLRGLPFLRNLGYGMLGYAAFDQAAGMFLDADHPVRNYGKWIAGGVGLAAPEIVGRTALGQRLASTAVGSRLAPIASRLTWGLAAVWALDMGIRHFAVGSDYEASINSRVTTQVYREDGLYDYSFWKCVNPLSWLNKSRRVFRAVAPSAIEWAVADLDNEDLKDKMYAEDLATSKELTKMIQEIVVPFLHSENWEDVNEAIVLLRDKKIVLSQLEQIQETQLATVGPDGLKSFYPHMSEEDVERLCRKILMKRVQEAASFLVYVDQDENDWARELFNQDGTLKGAADANGEYPYEKLKRRWNPPPPEKTEVTSEAFELVGNGDLMG